MEKEAALEFHSVLEGALVVSVHRHRHTHTFLIYQYEMSAAEANKKRQKDLLSKTPALEKMSLGHSLKKKKNQNKRRPTA